MDADYLDANHTFLEWMRQIMRNIAFVGKIGCDGGSLVRSGGVPRDVIRGIQELATYRDVILDTLRS